MTDTKYKNLLKQIDLKLDNQSNFNNNLKNSSEFSI